MVEFSNKIVFSNKTHYHFNGSVATTTDEKSMHLKRVTVTRRVDFGLETPLDHFSLDAVEKARVANDG